MLFFLAASCSWCALRGAGAALLGLELVEARGADCFEVAVGHGHGWGSVGEGVGSVRCEKRAYR